MYEPFWLQTRQSAKLALLLSALWFGNTLDQPLPCPNPALQRGVGLSPELSLHMLPGDVGSPSPGWTGAWCCVGLVGIRTPWGLAVCPMRTQAGHVLLPRSRQSLGGSRARRECIRDTGDQLGGVLMWEPRAWESEGDSGQLWGARDGAGEPPSPAQSSPSPSVFEMVSPGEMTCEKGWLLGRNESNVQSSGARGRGSSPVTVDLTLDLPLFFLPCSPLVGFFTSFLFTRYVSFPAAPNPFRLCPRRDNQSAEEHSAGSVLSVPLSCAGSGTERGWSGCG